MICRTAFLPTWFFLFSCADVSKEIRFLIDNLGKDWKFFMRALGLQESKLEMCMESQPRNVREQMHMAFTEWREDCRKAGRSPKKADLLIALKEIRRNDLHHSLSSGSLWKAKAATPGKLTVRCVTVALYGAQTSFFFFLFSFLLKEILWSSLHHSPIRGSFWRGKAATAK